MTLQYLQMSRSQCKTVRHFKKVYCYDMLIVHRSVAKNSVIQRRNRNLTDMNSTYSEYSKTTYKFTVIHPKKIQLAAMNNRYIFQENQDKFHSLFCIFQYET